MRRSDRTMEGPPTLGAWRDNEVWEVWEWITSDLTKLCD